MMPHSDLNANIHSMDEFKAMDRSVEVLIVDSNACKDDSFTILNLTRFVNLRVFEVGDYSFSYVEEVHLVDLSNLERVVIGEYSFSNLYESGNADDYQFHLKNCERLRELRIGSQSFVEYNVFDVENVPSLEVIEIGNVIKNSQNFYAAPQFELKSTFHGTRMTNRFTQIEIAYSWWIGVP